MKPSTPNFTPLAAAAILLAAIAPSFAQTTATTDPVGFMTLTVAGGTGSTAALTVKSLGLTTPVAYQGVAETADGTGSSSAANILIDTDAPTSPLGYAISPAPSTANPYYLEITSGTAAGTTYDVSSISGTTITLAQNLASTVAAPVSFKLRKHWTLGTVFQPTDLTAGTVLTADTVSIYSATTASYDTYYYRTGQGWRKTTDGVTDAGPTPIYPDDALVVSRKNAAAVPVVVTGSVKTGQTSFPIATGLNILSNPYAAAMTLSSCGIYNAGDPSHSISAGTVLNADQVQLFNGSGYDLYYYRTGQGWRKTTDNVTDAGPTPIPAGAAILVKRNGAPFNWIIPQHPATL